MKPLSVKQARYVVYGMIGMAYFLAVVTSWLSGIELDLSSSRRFFLFLGFMAALSAYARFRQMQPLDTVVETIICGLAVTYPILFATYVAMGSGFPLADHRLVAWDTALGFKWETFILAVDDSRFVSKVLQYGYSSFSFQLLLIPIYFAFAGKPKLSYAFAFAYILANFFSSVIGAFFPALGAYTTFDIAQSDLQNINAQFGFQFLKQFHAVRDVQPFTFRLKDAQGILTFPSMHAAGALLCGWMAWKARFLRAPALLLNTMMAISALSHGSHYLVDVLMGLVVALGTILVTERLFGLRERQSSTIKEVSPVPVNTTMLGHGGVGA